MVGMALIITQTQQSNKLNLFRLLEPLRYESFTISVVNGEVSGRQRQCDRVAVLKYALSEYCNISTSFKLYNWLLVIDLFFLGCFYTLIMFFQEEMHQEYPFISFLIIVMLPILATSSNIICKLNEYVEKIEFENRANFNLKINFLLWEPKGELLLGYVVGLLYTIIELLCQHLGNKIL